MYKLSPITLIKLFRLCAKAFRENIDTSESDYIETCKKYFEELYGTRILWPKEKN